MKYLHGAMLALLLAGQIGSLFMFRNFAVEDSYIVARYVRNVVSGNGLVYNLGERVTALTSPAHALTVSALAWFTGSPAATNRALSVVLLLATEAVVLLVLRRRPGDAVVFAAVVALCPLLNLWSVGGLETMYLLACITALVLLVRATEGRLTNRSALAASFLLGLGFLTRYDAVVFLLPVAVYLLARNRRLAIPLIAPGLVMTLGWFGFSQRYFHDIFPTSLYVKTPGLSWRRGLGNIAYELHLPVLCGAIFAVAWPTGLRRCGWLIVALAGAALYGVSTATTHMFFAQRLLIPYLPAFAILLLDLRPNISLRRMAIALPLIVAANGFTMYWVLNEGIDPRLPFVEADASPRHRTLAQYEQLMHVLVRCADDINRHAAQHPLGRPPRILTFAGGYLPYHCPDAYVFENLVSYRKYCSPPGAWFDRFVPYADYVHVVFPLFGDEKAVLHGKRMSDFEVVSSYRSWFDTDQTVYVLYQKDPRPNPLPPTVDGKCAAEP